MNQLRNLHTSLAGLTITGRWIDWSNILTKSCRLASPGLN
jgi:hypothetical protein